MRSSQAELRSSAANLTAWGIQDCARDPDNGAFGAALPKLLFRHLPRHYTPVRLKLQIGQDNADGKLL